VNTVRLRRDYSTTTRNTERKFQKEKDEGDVARVLSFIFISAQEVQEKIGPSRANTVG